MKTESSKTVIILHGCKLYKRSTGKALPSTSAVVSTILRMSSICEGLFNTTVKALLRYQPARSFRIGSRRTAAQYVT